MSLQGSYSLFIYLTGKKPDTASQPQAESASQAAQPQQPVTYRQHQQNDYEHSSSGRSKKSSRPLTAYDLLQTYSIKGPEGDRDFMLPPPPPSEPVTGVAAEGSHKQHPYSSAFTPSDNSIDESVKSGHAGKEVSPKTPTGFMQESLNITRA